MARGHVDAEVASQRSAQSLFEYRQCQLKGTAKYKRGLAIQQKKVKMTTPKKIERARAGSLLSGESEGEPMEVTYNTQGDTAGTVMGKARSTLRLMSSISSHVTASATYVGMIDAGKNQLE